MTIVEQSYEEAIRGQYSAGPIFALKNCGWTDKVETENKNVNEHTVNLRDKTLDKLEETEEGQKILEQVVDYL